MGYDLHITRKSDWFDEDGDEITLDEWCDFVQSSPDMRLDGYAEAETANSTLRVESEGLSVWTGILVMRKTEIWLGLIIFRGISKLGILMMKLSGKCIR